MQHIQFAAAAAALVCCRVYLIAISLSLRVLLLYSTVTQDSRCGATEPEQRVTKQKLENGLSTAENRCGVVGGVLHLAPAAPPVKVEKWRHDTI